MNEELENFAKEIYKIGFKNGAQEMKNKTLKGINRDISLFTTKNETVRILDKVDKMKLPTAKLPENTTPTP